MVIGVCFTSCGNFVVIALDGCFGAKQVKILKGILKLFAILVVVIVAIYAGFLGREYWRGNDYVDYLAENIESVPLDQKFSFNMLRPDIQTHGLVLVGEIHGLKQPNLFDVEFFSYLNANHQFTTYLLEMDASQAYFLNQYNQTGDKALLQRVLSNWVVTIGRENSDYTNKFEQLRELSRQGSGFTYVGTDRIADYSLLFDHVRALTGDNTLKFNAELERNQQLSNIDDHIQKAILDEELSSDVKHDLEHLLANIQMVQEKAGRETVMTTNLLNLYERLNLYQSKVYGYYGLGHTLQHELASGHRAMASRLQQANNWFENNIITINTILLDSVIAMKTNTLLSFMQTNDAYTKAPLSYDSIWFSYLFGIMDLSRVTEPSTKSLVKLDGKDSPYQQSNRLFTMTKLLPIGQEINAAEGAATSDYGQYVLFIRNSDWAQPQS